MRVLLSGAVVALVFAAQCNRNKLALELDVAQTIPTGVDTKDALGPAYLFTMRDRYSACKSSNGHIVTRTAEATPGPGLQVVSPPLQVDALVAALMSCGRAELRLSSGPSRHLPLPPDCHDPRQ